MPLSLLNVVLPLCVSYRSVSYRAFLLRCTVPTTSPLSVYLSLFFSSLRCSTLLYVSSRSSPPPSPSLFLSLSHTHTQSFDLHLHSSLETYLYSPTLNICRYSKPQLRSTAINPALPVCHPLQVLVRWQELRSKYERMHACMRRVQDAGNRICGRHGKQSKGV